MYLLEAVEKGSVYNTDDTQTEQHIQETSTNSENSKESLSGGEIPMQSLNRTTIIDVGNDAANLQLDKQELQKPSQKRPRSDDEDDEEVALEKEARKIIKLYEEGKELDDEPPLKNLPDDSQLVTDLDNAKNLDDVLKIAQNETHSERRNRLSRQKNAFFVSTLCVKQEPIDEFTEVDVQFVGDNDAVYNEFTTDVGTLNRGQLNEKKVELKGKLIEERTLKMYTCDRNLDSDNNNNNATHAKTTKEENGKEANNSPVYEDKVMKSKSSDGPSIKEIVETMSSSKATVDASRILVSPQKSPSSHLTRFFECKLCTLCFKSFDSYHFHMRCQHGGIVNGTTTRQNYPCKHCKETMTSKKQLSRHLLFKHGGCGKSLVYNTKCSICGLAFLRRSYLKSHMRMRHK